jgi:hypothetical protein
MESANAAGDSRRLYQLIRQAVGKPKRIPHMLKVDEGGGTHIVSKKGEMLFIGAEQHCDP